MIEMSKSCHLWGLFRFRPRRSRLSSFLPFALVRGRRFGHSLWLTVARILRILIAITASIFIVVILFYNFANTLPQLSLTLRELMTNHLLDLKIVVSHINFVTFCWDSFLCRICSSYSCSNLSFVRCKSCSHFRWRVIAVSLRGLLTC